MSTYGAAAANAPGGYLLPTRAELIEDIDTGLLASYTETAFSTTQLAGRDGHAWAIRVLGDGLAIDAETGAPDQTIYVWEIRK